MTTENTSAPLPGDWGSSLRAAKTQLFGNEERVNNTDSSAQNEGKSTQKAQKGSLEQGKWTPTQSQFTSPNNALPHAREAGKSVDNTYWGSWNTSDSSHPIHRLSEDRNKFERPSEQLSMETLSDAVSHRLQVGEQVAYAHKLAKPTYIDALRCPYAVFRFQYRDTSEYTRMQFSG